MAEDVKFMRESPFWYFLARRSLGLSSNNLSRVLESLEQRAAHLSLPIHYPREHASSWAVLLQLFQVAEPYRQAGGRFGYEMMLAGFNHVFGPEEFAKEVLSRLLGNLRSPAFPDRTRDETIVDTFLANAMKLINEDDVDPGDDAIILQSCLTDGIMFNLGSEAVRPPGQFWETMSAEYRRRRPGFIRRQFSDPNSWLFD